MHAGSESIAPGLDEDRSGLEEETLSLGGGTLEG